MPRLATPAWPKLGKFKAVIPAAAGSAANLGVNVGGPGIQSPPTPSHRLPLPDKASGLIERTMRGFESMHHRNMDLLNRNKVC